MKTFEKGYNSGSGDWSFNIKESEVGIDLTGRDKRFGEGRGIPSFNEEELKLFIEDLKRIHEGMPDNMRIKSYYRCCEFNIHSAMMDAGLGNYGDIILGLLDEGYGFKSGDWDKGKKWYVHKDRTSLKPEEVESVLRTALKIIFRLLREYRQDIKK